jgi:hypothetical protein
LANLSDSFFQTVCSHLRCVILRSLTL